MDKKKLKVIVLIVLFIMLAEICAIFYTFTVGSGTWRSIGTRGEPSIEQALMEMNGGRSIAQILDQRQYGRYHAIIYFNDEHQLCVGVVLEGLSGDRYFSPHYISSSWLPLYTQLSEVERFMGISTEENDAKVAEYAAMWAQEDTLEYYTITSDSMDSPLYVTIGLLQDADGILEY